MKNLSQIHNKIIIILIIIFGLNLLISFNSQLNATANILVNSKLIYKNYTLNKKYETLENELNTINKRIDSVDVHGNYILSKIMGVNIDTTSIRTNKIIAPISIEDKINNTANIVSERLKLFIKTFNIVNKNMSILNSYPNISPLNIHDSIKITSGIGWRRHPIYKIPLYHKGVDLTAKLQTNAYSTMDGYVLKVRYGNHGYGNYIKITNTSGYEITYAHLSKKIFVTEGLYVHKGELIAETGNSGLSTAPHLHYEIRYNGNLENPADFILNYNGKFLVMK